MIAGTFGGGIDTTAFQSALKKEGTFNKGASQSSFYGAGDGASND